MFEQARWIGYKDTNTDAKEDLSGKYRLPVFKKVFTLPAGAADATVHFCALGYGEVRLNGQAVTQDVLTTAFTAFDKTVLFNSYTVTPLLRAGENVITVLMGNGWYNSPSGRTWDFHCAPWRAYPRLLFQLDCTAADGSVTSIPSDTTWTWYGSPILYCHVRAGEYYDARLEDNPGREQNVRIVRSPGGAVKPFGDYPPIRIHEVLPMKPIGGQVYDCGKNITGWVTIRVKGLAGQEIKLRYAENLKDGRIDPSNINTFNEQAHCPLQHEDVYVCKGEGTEEWHARFVYHGFRYIELVGNPSAFEAEAMFMHTVLPTVGTFACSDLMLGAIHAASCLSTRGNFFSVPTDCPHREQNGWTGDAALSAEQALMNFDIAGAYRKWMYDFMDAQRPSGQLPGIIPTGGWGFNWGSGPAWDNAMFEIPLRVWEYTGDSSLIALLWERLRRYMDFIAGMASDYLVDFGLGDWCPPRDCKLCPTGLTDTAYYYSFAVRMARFAALLGEDPAEYTALSAAIRKAFRERYFKDGIIESDGQTAWSCAVYQGLLDEDEIPAAIGRLVQLVDEKEGHLDCGILGIKYMFPVLSDHGHADLVYRMITNPDYPSYAHWIANGQTTLCEDWDMGSSNNHHMYSDVDLWFYRTLAGLRPEKDGFRHAVIRPAVIDGIDWVKATHAGYSVAWERSGGGVTLSVSVPEGCSARVVFGAVNTTVGSGAHTFAA
ncbi:MAG: glycoside hydrolase family 78 protein [Oscillospiraceae bacterium]|jgi:alpha-L-rhamnosidase|nr:glycoside hydrolase family 78 protein [Oscillospiraceae bacterium]